MRSNFKVRTAAVAAALALLVSGTVSAQLDEDPLPLQFEDIQTMVVLNSTSDPIESALVDRTASLAHEALGGRITNNKNNGYRVSTQPDTRATLLASLDAAKEGENLVVISGGDSQQLMGRISAYPNTVFIDVGQPLPCVDGSGRPDSSGTCEGGEFAIPGNYTAIQFEVEDPAYLAGVIAAAASERDRIGIISGLVDCEECNRYIQGFTLGAQSIKPDLDIKVAYLADESEQQAFTDGASAKTFAEAFIDVYQPDVLLPVAKGASISMIDAACSAGILAIGTGIDVSADHPGLAECVLTSVTKDVETAVRRAIYDLGNQAERVRPQTLLEEGVSLTEEWRTRSGLPVSAKDQYQDARDALITGAVDSCPFDCGSPFGLGATDVAAGEAAQAAEGEGETDTGDEPDSSDD